VCQAWALAHAGLGTRRRKRQTNSCKKDVEITNQFVGKMSFFDSDLQKTTSMTQARKKGKEALGSLRPAINCCMIRSFWVSAVFPSTHRIHHETHDTNTFIKKRVSVWKNGFSDSETTLLEMCCLKCVPKSKVPGNTLSDALLRLKFYFGGISVFWLLCCRFPWDTTEKKG